MPWPTWTTCASATSASWPASVPPRVAQAAAEWLRVVDDLDRALLHADDDPAGVVEGVLIRDQAVAVHSQARPALRGDRRAVRPGAARGRGRRRRPADARPGTVVVRPGYGTEEAVLRPAGVIVASGVE